MKHFEPTEWALLGGVVGLLFALGYVAGRRRRRALSVTGHEPVLRMSLYVAASASGATIQVWAEDSAITAAKYPEGVKFNYWIIKHQDVTPATTHPPTPASIPSQNLPPGTATNPSAVTLMTIPTDMGYNPATNQTVSVLTIPQGFAAGNYLICGSVANGIDNVMMAPSLLVVT